MLATPKVYPKKMAALASLDNRPDDLRKVEKYSSSLGERGVDDVENMPSPGAARCRLSNALGDVSPLNGIHHSLSPPSSTRITTATIKPKIQQRRKRMSPEQLRLMSRRIDPKQPLPSPHTSPSKPALPVLYSPSPRKRSRLQQKQPKCPIPSTTLPSFHSPKPQLFQTCFDIWPGAPSLGDLNHDNVKCLSELLKVRLSQAKFRLIAALEANDDGRNDPLYAQLKTESDDSWPFTMMMRQKITLSHKRHQSTLPVTVGNGKNLTFQPRQRRAPGSSAATSLRNNVRLVTDDTGKLSVAVTPPASPANSKKRKRPATSNAAKKSNKTKSEDATTHPFACQPCNKRYKNRSGLMYHLQRCKATINCICDQQDIEKPMVLCDTCDCWFHTACVEITTHESFSCPRCSPPPPPPPPQVVKMEQQQQDEQQQQQQTTPVLVPTADMQDPNWWPMLPVTEDTSPWNLSDLPPSLLFSDPLTLPEEEIGLMTPSSIVTNAQQDQSDNGWFEFANFDDDFTCE